MGSPRCYVPVLVSLKRKTYSDKHDSFDGFTCCFYNYIATKLGGWETLEGSGEGRYSILVALERQT